MALRSTQPPPPEVEKELCSFCHVVPTWPSGGYRPDSFPGKYAKFCHKHAFWHELLDRINDPTSTKIDLVVSVGTGIECFSVGEPAIDWSKRPSSLGYGGHWWHVKYWNPSGRPEVLYTNNLWARGDVPKDMQHLFREEVNVLLKRTATSTEIGALREDHRR